MLVSRSERTRSISDCGNVGCSATSASNSSASGKLRESDRVEIPVVSVPAPEFSVAPRSAARSAICGAERVVVPCCSIRAVMLASPGRSTGFTPLPARNTRFAATSGNPGRPLYRTVNPFESLNLSGTGKCNAVAGPGFDAPKPGPATALHLPVPDKFKLSNGLTVLYSGRPGLPLVAANLVLRAGSGVNPVDRPGLASMTARMLQQGTTTRSALQIADRAADLGATLNSGAGTDTTGISTRSLSRNFPEALELLADVALHPTFPQSEIERVRSERLTSIVQEKDEPFTLAFRVLEAALYGPRHTYGYPDSGSTESIKAISRDDLERFWKQNYFPDDAALVVTGNIKLTTLKPLLEKQFGAWKPGRPAAAAMSLPETTDAKLILVDRPGAPQTRLECFSMGLARSTPDYEAVEVMNADLGGLFSSRINMNLREAHGYTYGASSFFAYHRAPGPFIADGDVRTDVTAPATAEIFNELRRMRDTQMTPAELILSKDSIARSLPGRFERGTEAAASFAELFTFDLPLDYYSTLPDRINAVTTEQAQAMAQKYILPDKMIVLAVGDRAKIEEDMKKLNLGKVEIRDTDGKVVH